jgi:hypothetical protein
LLEEVVESPLKARLLGTKPVLTLGESWIVKAVPLNAHGVSRQKSKTIKLNGSLTESNHTPILNSVS